MAYQTGKSETGAIATGLPELGPAASRYQALMQYRQPYLDSARECSELTIPYLMPPEGWTGTPKLSVPFQGIGSRGVLNICSKLMLALFPPNSPFARLLINGKAEDQAKQADPAAVSKIEESLANIEKKMAKEVESKQWRPHLYEAKKHLVVCGNVLLFFPEKKDDDDVTVRVFHLDKYVVKRDPSGKLLEIVVKEGVSPRALDDKTLAAVKDVTGYQGDDKTCDLYTHVIRKGSVFEIYQEITGIRVPESEGSYPILKSPWLALRWTKIDGQDYGRGYVEDHLGDLKSVEGLSQSIIEGSAAAARVLFFVNPNGNTKQKDLEEAPNGAVRAGNGEDVTVLQMEKYNDFKVAAETSASIEKRLSQSFMLNSSAQRSGERVTAEEWRFMIQDIEDALGGIYSVLAHELQLPLVRVLMDRMTKEKKIPALPKGTVEPAIVTGLEALGRGHDLGRLKEFIKDTIVTLTPEVAIRYLNIDDLLKRLATGYSIETAGLVKTEQEMAAAAQAEAQQAQQQQIMQMIEKLGPAGMKLAAEKGQNAETAGSGGDARGAGGGAGASTPAAG